MNNTFSEFLMEVAYHYNANFDLRFGQAAFNVLYALDEDLANSIRGTDLDPFHDDEKLPEFLERLRSEWK